MGLSEKFVTSGMLPQNGLKFYKNDARYGAYKDTFPDGCDFYQSWILVPDGLCTISQLRKMKVRIPVGIMPVAGKRAMNGYYPLYRLSDCEYEE